MPDSTPSPASGGKTTKRKPETTPAKWSLLNLLETCFRTSDGHLVIVDPSVPGGATDEQWRELVTRTGVQIPIEQILAPWGQLSRRDFLNWCEAHLPPERRPQLYSKEELSGEGGFWSAPQQILFDSSKSLEKSEQV